MPKLVNATPKYRKHRASGQAVATIAGKDHYLGPYRSKASLVEYDRLVAEWLSNHRQLPLAPDERYSLTVAELLVRYWQFARKHYQKNGRATGHLHVVKNAIKPLRELYGRTPVADFGPVSLKAVRSKMVEAGLCRREVNRRTQIVKQVFRWATAEELAPPAIHQALSAVSGLQAGKTEAQDHAKVVPVPDDVFEETLQYMPPIVADMARVQRLADCRPGEACLIRPCDIDRAGDIWVYRPHEHKVEHHNRARLIFLGPKAQSILTPYLLRPATSYCFSPQEVVKKLHESRRARRKTPLQYGNSPGSNRKHNPKRKPSDHYTANSYRHAISRAVAKANAAREKEGIDERLPDWAPNRLRHARATELRAKYDLKTAQTILGHSKSVMTEIYAEIDEQKARDVMRQIG